MKSFLLLCLFFIIPYCNGKKKNPPTNDETEPASTTCQIDINVNTGSPQPLYIRPGTSEFFHPSDRRGIIELNANEQMEMFCVTFKTPIDAAGLITAECVTGTIFKFNGIMYDFSDFSCTRWPVSNAVRTEQQCYNNAVVVDVGFQVNERFLRVYTTCHDTLLETTHYTQYQLTPRNDGYQSGTTRPSWKELDFFSGKDVDSLYSRTTQRETIAAILESQSAAAIFIEEPYSQIYLSRGHLAAMKDFISANEQRSTFLFINAAPQWQSFNALNWYAVEKSTRQLAADRNITLDTYTGSFGVTHLWNEAGDRREIFLDFPAQKIPVPMIFYKIIVNQVDHSGVVLIGVNNVHVTLDDIQRDYIVCTDVSDSITYVNWVRTDIERGFSYACEVNDFLSAVPHVQSLNVTLLLV